LTGIAANLSMARKQPVEIASLVQDIGRPDYPVMPTSAETLPVK
jgi:hypothetical protein